MPVQRIVLDRLIAEHYSEEILSVNFHLPSDRCNIVQLVAEPARACAHVVDRGVVVQVYQEVKLVLTSGKTGYLSRESTAQGSFFYPMYTPEGREVEIQCETGELESFPEAGKLTVLVPCRIRLWYTQKEIKSLTLPPAESRDEDLVVADLLLAQGTEHRLFHQVLSIAVAEGITRYDLEVKPGETIILPGRAVLGGEISGGLYYAAPNGTERFLPVKKEFSIVISDSSILPGASVESTYHLEPQRAGRVLKVFLTLDWLVIQKEAISLPIEELTGEDLRVDRLLEKQESVVQFKTAFALGEEIRKIRDYQVIWKEVESQQQGGYVLVKGVLEFQAAGVTPLGEVKEFCFTYQVEQVFRLKAKDENLRLYPDVETQYLRMELLPRNYLGLLGQVKMGLTVAKRETLKVPAVSLVPGCQEIAEVSQGVYSADLALPRGFSKLVEVKVSPVITWAGVSGGSAQVQGELQVKALVETSKGQSVVSTSVPFWHFPALEGAAQVVSTQGPQAEVVSQELVREPGWKGVFDHWHLHLTIRVTFSTRTLRPK
ncbi:MAG: hypothetical protein H0Z38_00740 [Firmicutes bacterium]|nr:hypothetical protein [Bacillota bacterium]